MKLGFYSRLAFDGIRKNKRLYLPYILTCIGMVMMFYIMHYLASMPMLGDIAGGRTLTTVFGFGFWVLALFSVLFLFYSNSFLMRRRQKEFGLYNILGMGKKELGVLLLCESAILCISAILLGLICGILLSKLTELLLIALIDSEVSYSLRIDPDAVKDTFTVFIPIFVLIFLKNLISLQRLSATELLKSENVGEKPPKARYLLGTAGILILAGAYYIALSIKTPLTALSSFFIAVLMVICATYLLFISGSVMLCNLLRRRKSYYYKKEHFVSVSSMIYRMKRNGAGLASICILSTMVLVMTVGAASLYFGAEDSINSDYPHQFRVRADYLYDGSDGITEPPENDALASELDKFLEERGVTTKNEERYTCTSAVGLLRDGYMTFDVSTVNAVDMTSAGYVCNVRFIPLEDYNRCMGTDEVLDDGQLLFFSDHRSCDFSTITMADGTVWQIKKQSDKLILSQGELDTVIPSVTLVTKDIGKALSSIYNELGELEDECRISVIRSFDTELSPSDQLKLRDDIFESDITAKGDFYSASLSCRESEREVFYSTFGGVLFLAVILSVMFLSATVLIIYYKQISEGYEDRSRFEIMRKVGMTPSDIRKSINSQMLTLFLLPFLTAAMHLSFAFPLVQKLLALMHFDNPPLMLAVAAAVILLFGIFYILVYRLTSNSYYTIVSGSDDER